MNICCHKGCPISCHKNGQLDMAGKSLRSVIFHYYYMLWYTCNQVGERDAKYIYSLLFLGCRKTFDLLHSSRSLRRDARRATWQRYLLLRFSRLPRIRVVRIDECHKIDPRRPTCFKRRNVFPLCLAQQRRLGS